MAKSIDELCHGLGPTRERELREAHAAAQAARERVTTLQSELAGVQRELVTAEEYATPTAGVRTAPLAKAMTEVSALTARQAHLRDVAIPTAERILQGANSTYNSRVTALQSRERVEQEYQKIIADAQSKLDEVWAWRTG